MQRAKNGGRGMAVGEMHEEIIDDVRDIFCRYRRKYRYQTPNYMMFIDPMLPNMLTGLGNSGLIADSYIFINDKPQTMLLEVGNMRDGKWRYVSAPDGLPVRVLRIEFDRSAWIVNPRETKAEQKFFNFLIDNL